ncbi:exo-alpha-sialidase [Actinophytocola sp.]|uniref:exo-alpha-sialidase n=1 Tax=Actinophytocola sp. TaxID=1872138 RepID=UPI002D7ED99A|nr:exo-alpha-sialidase [Actinophytocola sp.]HET9144061.1 exo-alpha-sialidase [Actinophytocola sp.]
MKITALAASLAALIMMVAPWHSAPTDTSPLVTVQAASVAGMTTPVAPAPVPGQYRAFGLDGDHSGFPTVVRLADGRLRMMWRHGSAHASADGEILTSVSTDNGDSWSTPTHVTVDNGGDVRDPHLGPSGLSAVGGDVFLTYFVSVNGVPSGARVARSTDGGATFGPSVRIDPNMPYAAISAPVVKIGARLVTGFYGRKVGETTDSAYVAWSDNNGASWSTNRVAIGDPGSNNPFQEPWVVGTGNTAILIMRDGSWKSLAVRSWDMAANVWSPIYRNVLPNATGNSASVYASNGRIYTVYRDTATRAAKLASSGDKGVSWVVERELMPMPAGSTVDAVGSTYAHPVELGPGRIFCPLGMERSPTDSRLYLGWL